MSDLTCSPGKMSLAALMVIPTSFMSPLSTEEQCLRLGIQLWLMRARIQIKSDIRNMFFRFIFLRKIFKKRTQGQKNPDNSSQKENYWKEMEVELSKLKTQPINSKIWNLLPAIFFQINVKILSPNYFHLRNSQMLTNALEETPGRPS